MRPVLSLHPARFVTLALLATQTLTACGAATGSGRSARPSPVERLVELVNRPDPALGGLSWLAGTWATRDTGGVTLEVWNPARGGMMLGHGQTYDQGHTGFYEFLRIEAAGGATTLYAQPQGGAAAAFPVREQGPQSVVFANPQHDFPQVIGYARQGDVLRVHLEGTEGHGRRIIDLAYRCTGGACR